MLKVLFIEDDPDQLFLYQKGFELEKIEMIGAQNGKEAEEMIKKKKPDVILVDILLKSENGLDLMEDFQKRGVLGDIPVIIFTNYEKKEFQARAVKLGAIDYFLKSQHIPEDIAKRVKWIAMANGIEGRDNES
jgi:DNA-binding NtrC family response regulator